MSQLERSLEARRERTQRLTQVDAGTAMGEYLRCFWWPVAALEELDRWPLKKVRLLGEDLALFRCDDGTLGLVADRCPHRGAALSCGMTDGPSLRCAYHGWAFDATGQCVDTPAEAPGSQLKDRITIAGYPVQELGGMVFAYLGRAPAPLLPRFEYLVRDDLKKSVGVTHLPCNWLQVAENSLDQYHSEYLHGHHLNWIRARRGESPLPIRRHVKVDWNLFEYGIQRKRLWEGEREDADQWTVGHPLIFPGNNLFRQNVDWVELQFRVPIDNEHTIVYWYATKPLPAGETPSRTVPLVSHPWHKPDGSFIPETVQGADMMVWVTQGPITDHSLEHLGESDRGVALYRRTLLEEADRVARGEDPMGVIRDPAEQEPFLRLPLETDFTGTLPPSRLVGLPAG